MRVNQIQNSQSFQGSVYFEDGIEKIIADLSKAQVVSKELALVHEMLTVHFAAMADKAGLDYFVSSQHFSEGVSHLKVKVQDDAKHSERKLNPLEVLIDIVNGKLKTNPAESLVLELFEINNNIVNKLLENCIVYTDKIIAQVEKNHKIGQAEGQIVTSKQKPTYH